MNKDTEQEETTMQLAHVLFTDIVGYSRLPTDEQAKALRVLQEIVRGTAEVSRARSQDKLISIATGDGIALVFFNDPMAPVQCAMEISRALKGNPEIKLRMGIHSGPVDKIVDVNDSVNVAGAGINMAQRVMDSGDAGHILVSRRVAEDLAQYSTWQPFLHDLKEVEVKHGVRMHMFNLYTGDVGNSDLPEKIRLSKKRNMVAPAIGIAAVVVIIVVGGFLLLRRAPPSPSKLTRPESEFTAQLQKKTDSWVDSLFAAQAPNGGFKASPSAADATAQGWATAQGLAVIFSTQKNVDSYVPKIKNAFDYIEKVRRVNPAEGWNYYDNTNPYTVTEIESWVALGYIKSLESKTAVWNDSERPEIVKRIVRDLDEVKRRQDASGGWRPIRDAGPDFTRTYSTIMALWVMIDAKKSPLIGPRVGSQYDEAIRNGTNWLLQTYKGGQGWVQNPNRSGQKDLFEGLTAQTLFVISQEEDIAEFAYVRNDPTYRIARKDFINNKQLASRSIDKDNSHIPDADVRFAGSEFMAEGSTFLWFPWTLLELSRLSFDQSLPVEDREAATGLRLDILNANADALGNYTESGNLTYQFAENLFCVSGYINAVQAGKP